MVDAEIDAALREYARHLARQGVRPEGSPDRLERLRNDAKPGAIRRVKEYLLLDAIGEAESVAVSDTELDAEVKRRAQAMGTTAAELKAALVKNERLRGSARRCGSTAWWSSSSPRPRRPPDA